MPYDAIAIGDKLRDVRNNQNKSQKELVEALGIGQSSYSRFENGIDDLPFYKVIELCDYLGISVCWLINEQIPTGKLTVPELIELEQYRSYIVGKRNKIN